MLAHPRSDRPVGCRRGGRSGAVEGGVVRADQTGSAAGGSVDPRAGRASWSASSDGAAGASVGGSRVVGRYGRLDLLCLDELGYVQIDPRGAELLFQIITEREERASIAIATNLPFSEWGSVFPDPRLAAAIVDRVTFNAHILETGTQSYRLRTSKTTTRRKRAG
jgi:hypothetical protein